MFHPFIDVIPRRVEHILKLWADSWDLHSNNNLNGIQSIVGKISWSYGITSKENIAVRLCRIDHVMMAHNYTPAPPEGGILFYLCPSVLPSVQDYFRRILTCNSAVASLMLSRFLFCHFKLVFSCVLCLNIFCF